MIAFRKKEGYLLLFHMSRGFVAFRRYSRSLELQNAYGCIHSSVLTHLFFECGLASYCHVMGYGIEGPALGEVRMVCCISQLRWKHVQLEKALLMFVI